MNNNLGEKMIKLKIKSNKFFIRGNEVETKTFNKVNELFILSRAQMDTFLKTRPKLRAAIDGTTEWDSTAGGGGALLLTGGAMDGVSSGSNTTGGAGAPVAVNPVTATGGGKKNN